MVKTPLNFKRLKFESGICFSDLTEEFNMPRTTIARILKTKDAIKSVESLKV